MSAQTGHGWTPDDSTFGARLALIRQRMGWGNVKEAALACGLPVASWRNWERDGRMPRDVIGICRKISQTTGVDLAWLAGLPRQSGPGLPNPERQTANPDGANMTGLWSVPSDLAA